MNGLMQDFPLTVQHIFNHATQYFPRKEIVTRTEDGIHRYTYGDFGERVHRLANALRPGRPAGRPRRHLGLEQLPPPRALLRRAVHGRRPAHAQHPAVPRPARPTSSTTPRTRSIFVDRRCCPLCSSSPARCSSRRAVRRDGRRRRAARRVARDLRLRGAAGREPAALRVPAPGRERRRRRCATRRGTTGNPKGVVYSHRSTFLHSFGALHGRQRWASASATRPAGRADVPRQRLGPALRRRRWPARSWSSPAANSATPTRRWS